MNNHDWSQPLHDVYLFFRRAFFNSTELYSSQLPLFQNSYDIHLKSMIVGSTVGAGLGLYLCDRQFDLGFTKPLTKGVSSFFSSLGRNFGLGGSSRSHSDRNPYERQVSDLIAKWKEMTAAFDKEGAPLRNKVQEIHALSHRPSGTVTRPVQRDASGQITPSDSLFSEDGETMKKFDFSPRLPLLDRSTSKIRMADGHSMRDQLLSDDGETVQLSPLSPTGLTLQKNHNRESNLSSRHDLSNKIKELFDGILNQLETEDLTLIEKQLLDVDTCLHELAKYYQERIDDLHATIASHEETLSFSTNVSQGSGR